MSTPWWGSMPARCWSTIPSAASTGSARVPSRRLTRTSTKPSSSPNAFTEVGSGECRLRRGNWAELARHQGSEDHEDPAAVERGVGLVQVVDRMHQLVITDVVPLSSRQAGVIENVVVP